MKKLVLIGLLACGFAAVHANSVKSLLEMAQSKAYDDLKKKIDSRAVTIAQLPEYFRQQKVGPDHYVPIVYKLILVSDLPISKKVEMAKNFARIVPDKVDKARLNNFRKILLRNFQPGYKGSLLEAKIKWEDYDFEPMEGMTEQERTEKGWTTLLHIAADEGNEFLSRLLIEHGVPVEIQEDDGHRPLHNAAESGNLSLVKYLVEEKGADIHATSQQGHTPLYEAVDEGNLPVVKYLVAKGAKLDIQDEDGATLLHGAASAQKNAKSVLVFLVNKGLSLETVDQHGNTPLHEAALNDNAEAVSYLLQKGLDVNAQDQGGITPLMNAASIGSLGIANLLLENGADPNIQDDISGETALHKSVASAQDKEMVELLLKYGADKTIQDMDDKTPLDVAKELGSDDIVAVLQKESD